MDRHRIAFRLSLEKQQAFSARTIEGYVSASGRLLRLCQERGANLYAGELPEDALDAITTNLPPARARCVLRGAVLFLEFLDERGIPVPIRGAEATLSREQLARFLAAATEQTEPYATFLRLLPASGLSAQDLSRLELDDVTQNEHGLSLGDALMGADAEAIVRSYLRDWRTTHAQDSRTLFPSREGRPLSSSTITRRLRSVQKAAKLPEFRVSALSELCAVYYQARANEDANEDAVADAAPSQDAASGDACKQPDLPHISPSLGALPPDDEEGREPPRLHLVPPLPPDPPESIPPKPEPQSFTQPPQPTPAQPSITTPQESAPVDHDDDFEDDLDPPHQPPRKRTRGRGRTNATAPGARSQPHPNLRKLLGQRGTIYIRRRGANGRLTDIGQFSLVDIGSDRSVNTFIINQLVPVYGAGDYEVYLNPTDTESYLTVPVAEPLIQVVDERQRRSAVSQPSAASSPDLWEMMRYFDERESKRPSERGESFQEFYKRMRLEEEVEALRRDNARLSANALAPSGPLPPLPAGPPSLRDHLAEQYLETLKAQAAAASNPRGPLEGLEEIMKLKRGLEAAGLNSGGGTASERDFFDRLNDFLNGRAGQTLLNTGLASLRPKKSPKRKRQGGPRNATPKQPAKKSASKRRPTKKEPTWAPSAVPEHFPSEALAQAETAEEVLEALLLALMTLNFDEQWHEAVQALLAETVADERERALPIAASIAGALVHLGELERDTAEFALATMREQWTTLRARVLAIAQQEGGPSHEEA